ncbi:MAG TPA: hypothetical protein VF406_04630 [Thermodesulfobacteriota bacterium]
MATTVYHGTDLWGAARMLLHGIRPGLYVTDAARLAVRYAAAQATRTVDPDVTRLPARAVLVTIETPETVRWLRRDRRTARSLDLCEAVIDAGRILAVETPPDADLDAYLEAGRCRSHATPLLGATRMATTCLACAYAIVRAAVQPA